MNADKHRLGDELSKWICNVNLCASVLICGSLVPSVIENRKPGPGAARSMAEGVTSNELAYLRYPICFARGGSAFRRLGVRQVRWRRELLGAEGSPAGFRCFLCGVL